MVDCGILLSSSDFSQCNQPYPHLCVTIKSSLSCLFQVLWHTDKVAITEALLTMIVNYSWGPGSLSNSSTISRKLVILPCMFLILNTINLWCSKQPHTLYVHMSSLFWYHTHRAGHWVLCIQEVQKYLQWIQSVRHGDECSKWFGDL